MEHSLMSNGYRAESNPMIIASLLFANPATTQADMNQPRKRIEFAPNKVTVKVKGELLDTHTVHEYALSGKAGCVLHIQLMASENFTFSLVSPESRFVSNCNKKEWSGNLPVTGTYYLYVSRKGASEDSYQLEVSVF